MRGDGTNGRSPLGRAQGRVLLLLGVLLVGACSATIAPNPHNSSWDLELGPLSEQDDQVVLRAESEPSATRPEALEAARARALAEAAQVRETRVRSVVRSRVEARGGESVEDFLEDLRLDSEARFAGARVVRQEVREVGGEEPFVARVEVHVAREQVLVGEELERILSGGDSASGLPAFARRARARGDLDAAALGLRLLLEQAPDLESALGLVDLLEDAGRPARAALVARRWSPRVEDPAGLLEGRAQRLEQLSVDCPALAARLRLALEGARAFRTRPALSRNQVERQGPAARVELRGRVRPGHPLGILWLDRESLAAPAEWTVAGADVEARFEYLLFDWNHLPAGYVPGPVTVAVLSGDPGDPPPRLDPEVDLASPSPAERDRLARFVEEVQAWLQRGENEARVLRLEQR